MDSSDTKPVKDPKETVATESTVVRARAPIVPSKAMVDVRENPCDTYNATYATAEAPMKATPAGGWPSSSDGISHTTTTIKLSANPVSAATPLHLDRKGARQSADRRASDLLVGQRVGLWRLERRREGGEGVGDEPLGLQGSPQAPGEIWRRSHGDLIALL